MLDIYFPYTWTWYRRLGHVKQVPRQRLERLNAHGEHVLGPSPSFKHGWHPTMLEPESDCL